MEKSSFDHIFTFVRLAIASTIVVGGLAFAANELPQTFTLDGQLMLSGTSTVLLDPNAKLDIEILDPTKNCLLYEETQFIDTLTSNGYFSLQVGSSYPDAKRTGLDPHLTMAQIYANTTTVPMTAANAPGKTCPGGVYTPAAIDVRYFRLIVTPSSTNVADTMSPDTTMDSVPMATVAQTVQGYGANQLLILGAGDLTQANLTSVFAAGNAAKLNALLAISPSSYVTTNATSGAVQIPTVAGTPPGVTAGQIWYDAGVLKYYDGTHVDTVGSAGAGVAASGDVSGTYPALTVTGLEGVAVSATAPTTAGQVLRYNGTSWASNFVAMTDLRSTVTGANQFGSSCGAGQTLTYNTVGDVMSCQNIAVSSTQVTYAAQTANTVFAGPSSAGPTVPSFRALTAADIPSLPWSQITSGAPTTLAGYGITNAVQNLGGSPGVQTGVDASKPISPTAGTIYFANDTKIIYQYNSGAWVSIASSSGAGGTVTSASVTTANGFAGTVATSTTTPAITITTSVTGITKGNGTVLSAATVGTDYSVGTSALGTGLLKSTTGTGALSIAGASDITSALGYTPVNKTGDSMSGNLTFAANIGNIYTAGSGANTVTVEGPSAAIGTSYVLRLPTSVAASSGQVLTSDTSGNLSWTTPSTTATSYSGILPIANGGTNSSTVLGNNQLMVSSGGKIIEAGALTNGQLFVGSTGAAPVAASITAGSGVTVTNSAGGITIAATGSGGTVTSVGLSLPSIFTVTNSPVTTTGTLTGALASETANTFLAAPNGSAGAPVFRAIATADLPTIPVSGGGTGATTAAGARSDLGAAASGSNADITSTSLLTSITSTTSAITIAPTGALNLSPSTAVVSSAVIETPLGTAAAPSYTDSTNPNTGMYFPTSTSLGFSTAGGNAMTILSSGNVGIGTITPSTALQVSGTVMATTFSGSGASLTSIPNTALPTNIRARSLGYVFDGAGAALSGGRVSYYTVPFSCTISAWSMTLDTGTATVDVWKIATGTAVPTVSNTITSSATPAISSGTALRSTTLTGWTTAVAANDIIAFDLKAVSSATNVSLVLECDQ